MPTGPGVAQIMESKCRDPGPPEGTFPARAHALHALLLVRKTPAAVISLDRPEGENGEERLRPLRRGREPVQSFLELVVKKMDAYPRWIFGSIDWCKTSIISICVSRMR